MPKKDGAGKGNWGTETDELTGETEPTQTTDEETKTKTAESGTEDAGEKTAEETGGEEQAGEKEEEKPRMTLDEWKAQHKMEQPHFNVRKAGEGSDQKAYQNFVPIPKDAVDQSAHEDEEDTGAKVKRTRAKQLDIELNFAKAQRSHEGMGGRGGGRGGERNCREGGDRRPERSSAGGPGGGAGGGGGGGRFAGGDRRGGGPPGQQGGRRVYDQDRRQQGPSGSGSGAGNASFNLSAEAFPALGAH